MVVIHVPVASQDTSLRPVFRRARVIGPDPLLPTGGEDHLATMLALAAAVQHMHPRMLLISNYLSSTGPLDMPMAGSLDRTQSPMAM